jgi:hypothetical protein
VRGSPILRFLLLALALAATAVALSRVTAPRTITAPSPPPTAPTPSSTTVPFQLQLSAPASAVEMDTGTAITLRPEGSQITGQLQLDSTNPHLNLIVRWQTPAGPAEHRFAKLTLEAPGQDTFSHVFDATGDIDDFLELPLSAAP